MALKTMSVIQLASGRLVTINAKDFDNNKYALPGEPAKAPVAKAKVEPPIELPPPPETDVDSMLSALSPKAQEKADQKADDLAEEKAEDRAASAPRRRGR